jgi:hypothetical protein
MLVSVTIPEQALPTKFWKYSLTEREFPTIGPVRACRVDIPLYRKTPVPVTEKEHGLKNPVSLNVPSDATNQNVP